MTSRQTPGQIAALVDRAGLCDPTWYEYLKGLPSTDYVTAAVAAKTGPAFSAYSANNFSVTLSTYTKVPINTEFFDTDNCFDSTTNYRFTPNKAGKYFVCGNVQSLSASTQIFSSVWLNGSITSVGAVPGVVGGTPNSIVNSVVTMNGTTDYIELYVFQTATSNCTGSTNTNFAAFYLHS